MNGTNSTLRALSITNANGTSPAVKITGDSNTIVESYIGIDPADAAAPNAVGIFVTGNNNRIGTANASDWNEIAFNTGNGITIGTGTGNTILNNSTHDNGLLGIDLGND